MSLSRGNSRYDCSEGLALLNEYLQALDAHYQAHVPYISALQAARLSSLDAYLTVIEGARDRLRRARRNLVEHQEDHGCTTVLADNFREDFAA